MGIFDKFKSQRDIAKEEIKDVPWTQLERIDQLEKLDEISATVPVIIFKHSTTCGISRMALRQFEENYDFKDEQLEPYFLNLKEYRDLSQEIAKRYDVQHESPQILLIKNGNAVYHASHGSISAEAVKQKI